MTGSGEGLGAESGSGLRAGLTTRVGEDRDCGASCGAGEIDAFERSELRRESAGDAEGCLIAGELIEEEDDFALASVGFGGVRKITSNFEPLTLSLTSLRGRCPSEFAEFGVLSDG